VSNQVIYTAAGYSFLSGRRALDDEYGMFGTPFLFLFFSLSNNKVHEMLTLKEVNNEASGRKCDLIAFALNAHLPDLTSNWINDSRGN
jgi:hypothetical protein